MNGEVKPISPRVVRERIKERYTLPDSIVEYINWKILSSFDWYEGKASLTYEEFSSHCKREHIDNVELRVSWFETIPNVFKPYWDIEEKIDSAFGGVKAFIFKEKENVKDC